MKSEKNQWTYLVTTSYIPSSVGFLLDEMRFTTAEYGHFQMLPGLANK